MADPKDTEKAVTPAPSADGTAASVDPASESSSVENPPDNKKVKTYYLREGHVHHHIVKGEAVVLDQFGDKADLSPEQAQAFGDKFMDANEYKAQKAGRDVRAETAVSAEQITDGARAEAATINEAQAQNAANAGDTTTAKGTGVAEAAKK